MDRIAPSSRLTSASFTSSTRSSSSTTFHAAATTPDAFETRFGKHHKVKKSKFSIKSWMAAAGTGLMLTACSGAQSQTAPVNPSSSVPPPAATSSPAPSTPSPSSTDCASQATGEFQQQDEGLAEARQGLSDGSATTDDFLDSIDQLGRIDRTNCP